MKKISVAIILVLLLAVIPSVSSQRIEPTRDIGLFVSQATFLKGLQCTPLFPKIINQETVKYTVRNDVYEFQTIYKLEGGVRIVCFINKFGMIGKIRILFDPLYFVREDSYSDKEITRFVVFSTGLLFSEADYKAIDKINAVGDEALARNFFIEKYTTDNGPELFLDISSPYRAVPGVDPYQITEMAQAELEDGVYCDKNYVGACIPPDETDLNCAYLYSRNFFVIGNDHYHLDGDNNGVCCEPYIR